jgi:rhodanese-related sulfurtransferase
LVDVRTAAERAVSVIPGSVPLKQIATRGSVSHTQLLDPDTTVVTYCTIGYRSGMEAIRLLHRFPTLQGRIYNLDGIVAYTYADATTNHPEKQPESTDECSPLSPPLQTSVAATTTSDPHQKQSHRHHLIDPVTNCAVYKVHTFGSMWSLADPHYQSLYFPLPQLAVRLGQVGGLTVVRFVQRVAYHTVQCCCCYSSSNAGAAEE